MAGGAAAEGVELKLTQRAAHRVHRSARSAQARRMARETVEGWQPQSGFVPGSRRKTRKNTISGGRRQLPTVTAQQERQAIRSPPNIGTFRNRRPKFATMRRSPPAIKPRTSSSSIQTVVAQTKRWFAKPGRTPKETNTRRMHWIRTILGAATPFFHQQPRKETTLPPQRRSTLPPDMVPPTVGSPYTTSTQARWTVEQDAVCTASGRTPAEPTRTWHRSSSTSRRQSTALSRQQRVPSIQAERSPTRERSVLLELKEIERTSQGSRRQTQIQNWNASYASSATTIGHLRAPGREEGLPPSRTGLRISSNATIPGAIRFAQPSPGTPWTTTHDTVRGENNDDPWDTLCHHTTEDSNVRIHEKQRAVRGQIADGSQLRAHSGRSASSHASGRHRDPKFKRTDGNFHRPPSNSHNDVFLRMDPSFGGGQIGGLLGSKHLQIRWKIVEGRRSDVLEHSGKRRTSPQLLATIPISVQTRNPANIRDRQQSTRPNPEPHGDSSLFCNPESESIVRIQPPATTMDQISRQPQRPVATEDADNAQQSSTARLTDLLRSATRGSSSKGSGTPSSNSNRRYLRDFVWSNARSSSPSTSDARVPADTTGTVSRRSSAPHPSGTGRDSTSRGERHQTFRHSSEISSTSHRRTTERQQCSSQEPPETRGQTIDGTPAITTNSGSGSPRINDHSVAPRQTFHGQPQRLRRHGPEELSWSRTGSRVVGDNRSSAKVADPMENDGSGRLFLNNRGPTNVDPALHIPVPASSSIRDRRSSPKLPSREVYGQNPVHVPTGTTSCTDIANGTGPTDRGSGSGTILPPTTSVVATIPRTSSSSSSGPNVRSHARPSSWSGRVGSCFDPTLPTDCRNAIDKMCKARGIDVAVIDVIDQSYADGLHRPLQPWASMVLIGRERGIQLGTEWSVALPNVLTELFQRKLYNRTITTARATLQVLKIGANIDLSNDETIKKIRRAAEKLQQSTIVENGGGKAWTTIWLRRFHIRVISLLDPKDALKKWPFVLLRTTTTNLFTMLFALRPQEVSNDELFREAIVLTTNVINNKKTLTKISIRLFDSKDTKAKGRNNHERSGKDKAKGKWSSLTSITIPISGSSDFPLPPISDIVLEYARRRDARQDIPSRQIHQDGKLKSFSPFFVGAPNLTSRTKYPPTVQNSTLTSAARRQLVDYGAIENTSDPHDFGDIRKTVLTNVLHGQPSSLTHAHRIARHARETFFASYELDVPTVQADVLERFATMEETPPLTVVMLA